jgi:hypothetical protein
VERVRQRCAGNRGFPPVDTVEHSYQIGK